MDVQHDTLVVWHGALRAVVIFKGYSSFFSAEADVGLSAPFILYIDGLDVFPALPPGDRFEDLYYFDGMFNVDSCLHIGRQVLLWAYARTPEQVCCRLLPELSHPIHGSLHLSWTDTALARMGKRTTFPKRMFLYERPSLEYSPAQEVLSVAEPPASIRPVVISSGPVSRKWWYDGEGNIYEGDAEQAPARPVWQPTGRIRGTAWWETRQIGTTRMSIVPLQTMSVSSLHGGH